MKPPSMTEAEEKEEEETKREESRLKRMPTFANEKFGVMDIEGFGLGDFCRNKAAGRAKLLKVLKENDPEWIHQLIFEAERKNLKWMHEPYYGQTPWMLATQYGSLLALKTLVKFSLVDKTTPTSAGASPLFQCVACGHLHVLAWFLSRKDVEGNVLLSLPAYDINGQTLDGRTALWQAAYTGRKDLCEALLAGGANPLRISNPGSAQTFLERKVQASDVCLALPKLERVKVLRVEGRNDALVRKGDKVEARYGGGAKYYPAVILNVDDKGRLDLRYNDGGKEFKIDPKFVNKLKVDSDDEPDAVLPALPAALPPSTTPAAPEKDPSGADDKDKAPDTAPDTAVAAAAAVAGADAPGAEAQTPPGDLQVPSGSKPGTPGDDAGGAPVAEVSEALTAAALLGSTDKNRKPPKVRQCLVRYVHDGTEATLPSDKLKIVKWLGTLPSEAARAAGHDELYKWLIGEELKHKAKTKLKLKAVGGLAGILLQNREEINKKYEGMV